MAENKVNYYTPEISDLFVGYEYEFHHMSVGGFMSDVGENGKFEPVGNQETVKLWMKETITTDPWIGRDMKSAIEILKDSQMRTKYLDKQDIEKESWENLNHYFRKKDYKLIYEVGSAGKIVGENAIFPINPKITIFTGANIFSRNIEAESPIEWKKPTKILYQGNCKSINELRKICQFLEIK